MYRITAVCAVLLLALACQAFAVTAVIENFDGAYVNGSIGPMPSGWSQFGYGVPAYMQQETGLVTSGSAARWNVPGTLSDPDGTIAIFKTGQALDSFALAGSPIDWTKPVYLRVDVYGADYGVDTKWRTMLEAPGGVTNFVEWDDTTNSQWTTLSCTINPSNKSGNIIMFLDFDFTNKAFGSTNTAIWDNLRMDYSTTVPEPSSIVALITGLLGLGGIIRRRK